MTYRGLFDLHTCYFHLPHYNICDSVVTDSTTGERPKYMFTHDLTKVCQYNVMLNELCLTYSQ